MANIQISQLPNAQPLTGQELVPLVQQGVTVKTTAAALAGSPSQQQTFLTKDQEPTLPNSRYLSTDSGLGVTDGGAQSYLRISLTGASASLNAAGTGLLAKTSATTVVDREIETSGAGLTITNGTGVAGNPTLSLSGLPLALAGASGTGLLAVVGGTTIAGRQIVGTTNQIDVANGNGGGNPTLSIADNAVLPGTGAVTIPVGTTAQQPAGADGQIRYNASLAAYEGYSAGAWQQFSQAGGVTSFSAGSTGLTPSSPATGLVTLGGTLNVANGGTGASTLTGYLVGNGASPVTAIATIPNAGLTYSSLTINGTTISLGGSATITAPVGYPLTIGTGLSGGSYDGSSAVTIAIDSTVATLAGTQTFTNKSISGSTNTLTNVPNAALTNSSLTVGSTVISLGGTSTTLAGLTSVTLTQDPALDLQAATKQYVDAKASTGLTYHEPVQVATTQSLAAQTGGTVTYNNGASGVGATITLSVALSTLDGYTLANTNRVLVKDEINQTYNGIYTWATGGTVLTRATDADTYGPATGQLSQNDYFFIQNGTVNRGSSYVVTTVGTITFGTTAITFAEFSNSQVYSAGTGLTLTGTTFSISNTGVTNASYGTASSVPTIAVNAQGQITSASDTAIAINGNQITSGTVGSSYISGSYTGITGVGTLTDGTWNATAISDTYLSTISTAGKVSNSATTATNANTASAIVARDASGNFSAGTITAALSGNATSATNVAGGTAGAIVYNTGAGATTFLTKGTTNYVLTAGASAPQYVAQSTLSVGTATTATNATNTAITNDVATATTVYPTWVTGTSGNLPQKTSSTKLTFVPSTGVLTSTSFSGAGTGLTGTASSLSIGGTAATATNVAGGVANQILYQTGAGATSFITAPTVSSTYLQWNGSAFVWAASSGAGSVTSVDVSGGTTGLTTSGGPVTTSGTITLAGTLVAANGGTGQSTYTVGDILYASSTSALSKLAIGTTNQVLTSTGSAPQFVSQSTLSVGSATTATNATNVATTVTTTNADFYVPFVSTASSSNQALGVQSGLKYNPSTQAVTAGISGGTF